MLDWYKEFIATKEAEIGEGINSYRSTWRHFIKFLKKKKKTEIFLSDLKRALITGFREYLKSLNLDGTTIHKQFNNLRIFLNWVKTSEEDEDEIKIPSACKKIKVKARYGDPIGLTVLQFLTFFRFDLSEYPELERTRDLIVFGIAAGGTRYGDLKRIGDSLRRNGYNLEKNCLSYFEGKTGNAHKEIPINQFGLEILKQYPEEFPYVPSNQRMNQNLKTIAKMLDWYEVKHIPKYDEFGKLLKVMEVPLWKLFSTKFMRKIAATMDNFLKIPIKTSMTRTGHKTFAAYSRYVDVNKEAINEANGSWNDLFERLTAKLPKRLAVEAPSV